MTTNIETFATTADIGIRIKGRDYAELYRNAVTGLNQLYFPDGHGTGRPMTPVRFVYDGDGPENILVNLLNEVIYILQDLESVTVKLHVKTATETSIDVLLQLVHCDGFPQTEIKSVTYHDLFVTKKDGFLSAEVIFDV